MKKKSAGCGATVMRCGWRRNAAGARSPARPGLQTTAALTGMLGGGGDGQALPRAVESIVAAQQELQAQINLCGATRREGGGRP